MADEIDQTSHISTGNFKWGEVVPPGVRARQGAARPAAETPAEPPLGPLVNFAPGPNLPDDAQRVFKGNGFNTIFRPQNFDKTPTDLGGPGTGNNDNVLELNLTRERLTFSKSLGSVPNRGAKNLNGDIFLNGVPYIQRIDDITFGADNAVGIHFEPGVWLAVPATDNPQEVESFARMASIPHGTTINAQGIAFGTIAGPPPIAPLNITPFVLSNPATPIKFPSQTVANKDTFRLPQNLDGIAITQLMLDDPNSVLRDRLNEQTITSTDTLFVATNPPPSIPPFGALPPTVPDIGGGTDNIAFLQGDNNAAGNHPGANANAVAMSSIFWIETVQEEIKIPACKQGEDFEVQGGGPGELSVTFVGNAPCDIDAECPITVSYTQIQYSQLVVLNFSGLGWPHASVATLVPAEKIVLDRDAIEAAALAGVQAVPAAGASGDGSGA
jgi:hypothetical protein